MTLADKRKVIEVLLATADRMAPTMDEMIDEDFDACNAWFSRDAIKDAQVESDKVLAELPFCLVDGGLTTYDTCAITAAYRLIESSETLRREWFSMPERRRG